MDTNSSVYNDPRLQSARSNYESASNAAVNTESATYKLPDQLKSALTQKFSQDNPLVQGRERALQGYLEAGTSAPLAVTAQSAGGSAPVVYNPLQQADLIQKRRSVPTAQLSTANYLLGLAQGGMGDVIDSASRAAQAETVGAQGRAKIAGEGYNNILQELSAKAEEAFRERQFQEGIRQFNVSEANKKSAAGGGFDISGLLGLMGGGNQAPDLSGLSAFEEGTGKTQDAKPQPKVNLSGTIKAAKTPTGNQLQGQTGQGGWALDPIVNWFKSLAAPKLNAKSTSQLGF